MPPEPSPRLGATVDGEGVVYRLWAPGRQIARVRVRTASGDERTLELDPAGGGDFAGRDGAGRAGDRYVFLLDEGGPLPDAASRFQPEGVDGPSEVIDPRAYRWADGGWRRPPFRGRVIYELHIGTFTPEGSFLGAIARLDHVARLGANTIELMPVADFPGGWNWGYDGVFAFAPARVYGRPDDLRALVAAAHLRGLAVVLDVVYNHFGPCGNPLPAYSEFYYSDARETPWGRSFNFDGEQSGPVRRFFLQNAAQWIDEYHVDGLRLDATHAVRDASPRHVMAEVAAVLAARGAYAIAEDDRNEATVISAAGPGAWGFDAMWSDDHHHSVRVALTGATESYFGSFRGSARELVDLLLDGVLYHGQFFPHWGRIRGTPCGHLPPERLVVCLSNHDQVGNRALGDRLSDSATPEAYRAASVLLCLSPYTPLLFMGQEWSAGTPFLYFSDQPAPVGPTIAAGRRREFAALGMAAPTIELLPDPQAESSFRASQLRWEETTAPAHREVLCLYQTSLALRAAHPHFQNPSRRKWTAAVVGQQVALRWRVDTGDWLLIVSLWPNRTDGGNAAEIQPNPGRRWRTVLYSNERQFGGAGPAPTTPPGASTPMVGPAAWLLRED
jgi:maltooligosyltrehalose trehalohydrolase